MRRADLGGIGADQAVAAVRIEREAASDGLAATGWYSGTPGCWRAPWWRTVSAKHTNSAGGPAGVADSGPERLASRVGPTTLIAVERKAWSTAVAGCGLLSGCLRWPTDACATAMDPGCRYHRRGRDHAAGHAGGADCRPAPRSVAEALEPAASGWPAAADRRRPLIEAGRPRYEGRQ